MLSINRVYIYLLLLGIIFLIPSIRFITFLDELLSFSMFGVALFHCVTTGAWQRYRLLWIIIGIMSCYAIYSLAFLDNNTAKFILIDWIIELKPYIPFAVFLVAGPQFSELDKKIIRVLCLTNTAIVFFVLLAGNGVIAPIFTNPTFAAQIAFICSLLYLYCARDKETGKISHRNRWITIAILSVGLLSLKAKYFAMFIPSLYLLTIYKPGTFRKFDIKHAITIIVILAMVLIATWSKIQYYFLTGNSESFDPTVVQSYARPAMYLTGGQIMADYFPFGTGLASFGSAASSLNYSQVYFEYGLHNVHGISWRSEENFICDSFYPSLAQFGVVGLILFIWFWFYAYHFLRVMIRTNPTLYRAQFIAGSMIIIFILSESFGATTLTHNSGMITMCLLGMSCAFGRRILQQQQTESFEAEKLLRKI